MPTYDNIIAEKEISLAIERLLLAPYGTVWTPGRIWVDSTLPTSFIDMGAVVEDSPAVIIRKSKFQLIAGVPKIIQYEAVTTIEGEFTIALHSNSCRKVAYALGNVACVNDFVHASNIWGTIAATPQPTKLLFATSASSPMTTYGVGSIVVCDANANMTTSDNEAQVNSVVAQWNTMANSPWGIVAAGATRVIVTLSSSPATNIIVGDYVVTGTGTLILMSRNWAEVASINGLEVHLVSPGFDTAPSLNDKFDRINQAARQYSTASTWTFIHSPQATWKVDTIEMIRIPYGTSKVRKFAMLGVVDFIDGIQVVHYFPDVEAKGEISETIKPTENERIILSFDAKGYTTTTYGGEKELILGERYYFPKSTS